MLSVVIPTCNRNDLLSKCLDLLSPSHQTITEVYEVIVTDDSKENLAKALIESKYPWAKWVEGPKRGPAANRNNGARLASGEWLVFIDDDCEPIASLLNEYRKGIVVNPTILVFEGYTTVDKPKMRFDEESPINETGGNLWSCNFMINKEFFFSELNGFDETYPYAAFEDMDLNYRLKKRQISCLFLNKAIVIHPWRVQKNVLSITVKRYHCFKYFLRKFPEKNKEHNLRSCLRHIFGEFRYIFKKAIRYKFRGILKPLVNILITIYFSFFIVYRFLFIREIEV